MAGGERNLDPLRLTTFGKNDADVDIGVGVAGLRIPLHIHRGVGWNPVGDGVLRNRFFIHLQEGQAL